MVWNALRRLISQLLMNPSSVCQRRVCSSETQPTEQEQYNIMLTIQLWVPTLSDSWIDSKERWLRAMRLLVHSKPNRGFQLGSGFLLS